MEDLHRLLQLLAGGSDSGREDPVHARRAESRAAEHGAGEADNETYR